MEDQNQSKPSFLTRLGVGVACFFRVVADPMFAGRAIRLLREGLLAAQPAPQPQLQPKASAPPPEKAHASGLLVLAMLQREGRLIDFLQEDVASFADADIGAAARVVHAGCRKVLEQCLTLEPALKEAEGASVNVPAGFDAQRIRLTGNVAGQPPFRGSLKHHGWIAAAVRLPAVAEALDARVLAPAEVELS